MWLILYMRSVVYQTRNARWSIGKKTEKCSRILIMPDDARTHAGLHIGEHGTWLLLLLRQTMMRRLLKSCKRRCRVSESEWAANISSHTDRFMSSVRRLLVYIRLNTVSALMLYVCKVEHRSFVSASYFTIVPAVRSRTHRAVSKRPCQKLAHQICATELVLRFYSLTPTAFHQSGHTPCLWRPWWRARAFLPSPAQLSWIPELDMIWHELFSARSESFSLTEMFQEKTPLPFKEPCKKERKKRDIQACSQLLCLFFSLEQLHVKFLHKIMKLSPTKCLQNSSEIILWIILGRRA
jgi:hypothetical protein